MFKYLNEYFGSKVDKGRKAIGAGLPFSMQENIGATSDFPLHFSVQAGKEITNRLAVNRLIREGGSERCFTHGILIAGHLDRPAFASHAQEKCDLLLREPAPLSIDSQEI